MVVSLSVQFISKSPNIALYPALVRGRGGELACAWYEYGSPDEPARSDIWFSLGDSRGENWSDPVCISQGISYNNGPALLWSDVHERYFVAWHSWRPPGKEPLIPGGDINHIWVSESANGAKWSEPAQAFPSLPSTEYSTMAEGQDGAIYMVFSNRATRRLNMSRSRDGVHWDSPWEISTLGQATCPDLWITGNGNFLLAFTGEMAGQQKLAYARSDNGKDWKLERYLFPYQNTVFHRPKICADETGKIFVTAHTSSWGTFVKRYRVRLEKGPLAIRCAASGFGGDAFWNLNYIRIQGQKEISFNFGPLLPGKPEEEEIVSADCPRYEAKRSFGFDRPVREMLRELGTRETRGLIYGKEPTTFFITLAPGEYFVELKHGSWVSSTSKMKVDLLPEPYQKEETTKISDHCALTTISPNEEIKETFFLQEQGIDHNRVTKILLDDDMAKSFLAWTAFGKAGVKIALDTISGLNIKL